MVLAPLCYALAGFWLLPAYLQKALPERVSESTGMDLSIAAMDFNPFTFTFTGQDIQLDIPQPTGTVEERRLLHIDHLIAGFAPFSLLRNDLVTNALVIEGLDLNIVRSRDNRYNIENFFAAKRQGASSDIINFSELPFLFSLNNISVRGGRITFQDIASATTHTLDQIELDLPSLSNFPFETSNLIHPRFSGRFNGSKIELTGQAAIAGNPADQAGETKLSCNIKDLDVPLYFNYLPASVPFTISKGKADGKLELSFTRGSKEKEASLSLDFSGRFVDFAVTGKDGSFEAAIPDGILEGSLTPLDRQVKIRKLTISKPAVKSQAATLFELLFPMLQPAGRNPPAGQSAGSLERLGIDLLEITDGTVELASKDKPKPQSWSAVHASITGFSWSAAPQSQESATGTFRFSGEESGSGTIFEWHGDVSKPMTFSGPARIDNLPAASLLTMIGLAPDSIRSGSANLLGKLEISGIPGDNGHLSADCSEVEATFQNLKLAAGKNQWLDAAALKLTGLAKKHDRIHLGALSIENGTVTIESGNLPEPFLALAAKDSRLTLDAIDYTGSITVNGRNAPPLRLTSVLLQAASLNGKAATGDTVLFSAKVNDKGNFKAKGTARLTPLNAMLNIGFSGIEASALLPRFTSDPILAGARADVSGKGQLSLPGPSYTGDLNLDGAVFKSAGRELTGWKRCGIHGLSYVRSPFRLTIDQMDIDAPALAWQRASAEKHPAVQFGAFVQQLLPAGLTKPGKENRDGNGPSFAIKTVSIANGEIKYGDNRHDPPWQAPITALKGTISDIRFPGAAELSRFAFTGTIDQTPFALNGSADLLGSVPRGETTFRAAGLSLPTFGRYLPSDIGLDGRYGSFDIESTGSWRDGRLIEQTQLVFSGVQAISPESDAALPLALLKNSDGKIPLKVRIERDLEAGSIPVLEQAMAVFKRQVIKAKVSPILLTDGDFADLVGNEFIEFQPAEFSPTEGGQAVLSRFATFLKAHPYVGVKIVGAADRVIDGEAMNAQLERLENQRVAEENERRKAIWQKKRDTELERRRSQIDSSQGFIEEDLMADFPEFVPLKPAPVGFQEPMLAELARNRATLAQRLLAEQLASAPSRISVSREVQIAGDPNMPANRALFELEAWNPPKMEAPAAPDDRQH